MNNLIISNNIKIENMIYEIRGKQIMLDSDLAILYNCANGTKSINLAVKRNINRFPERFMFQLKRKEYYKILRFQVETLGLEQGKYSKYLPFAFTEQGVAMLATVLKTKLAEEISIKITDAFVSMRKYIAKNNCNERISNLETKIIDYDNKFYILFSKFDKIVKNNIFFERQIYYAYSLMMDILNKAKKEIIIIDKQELYHCGASFKELGKKCFAINLIEDKNILKNILNFLTN